MVLWRMRFSKRYRFRYLRARIRQIRLSNLPNWLPPRRRGSCKLIFTTPSILNVPERDSPEDLQTRRGNLDERILRRWKLYDLRFIARANQKSEKMWRQSATVSSVKIGFINIIILYKLCNVLNNMLDQSDYRYLCCDCLIKQIKEITVFNWLWEKNKLVFMQRKREEGERIIFIII